MKFQIDYKIIRYDEEAYKNYKNYTDASMIECEIEKQGGRRFIIYLMAFEVKLNIWGGNMNTQEKIANGEYDPKSPFTSITKDRQAWDAYHNERMMLHKQFQSDLETEFDTTEFKNKQKIFDMAWNLGHSSGWNDVLNYYKELVDLITSR